MALANDTDALEEEVVGRVLGDMDTKARLQFVELLLYLEDDEREFVGGAVAIAVHTSDIDISEVVVGTALESRDTHLGRCGLVVELNPEARQQFLGSVAREGAVGEALLVEGP